MTRRLRGATVPALLFTVLFCIYMLTYSGLATAADELSILAVSESLRTRGQFSTDQLAWAVWQHGWMAQGTLAPDDHVYSKKGPGCKQSPHWLLSPTRCRGEAGRSVQPVRPWSGATLTWPGDK